MTRAPLQPILGEWHAACRRGDDMESLTQSLPVPLRARLLDALQSTRGLWIVAAIGFTLSLPSLGFGLVTDDHAHLNNARLGVGATSFFEFQPEHLAEDRDRGLLAWWSSPRLALKFFRPLAAHTHILEFRSWPDATWLMHLWNALLYAALVAVAWRLYREFLPEHPQLVALAALMFAIDDGHAPSVGWISGRNTLLANLFAFSALLLHVRARKRASPPLHLASAASLALALCSAEAGVAAGAYLFAFALVYESGSWLKRAATLAPQLAVFATWAVVYFAGGFGAHHASYYRELTSPLTLLSGLLDTPSWLASLLGPSLVGAFLVAPVGIVRAVAFVACLPLLIAMWRAVPRNREQRFFLVGSLACLPPLFTTLPQDRLLITASFGAFGLLASFLVAARGSASRLVRGARAVSIAIHFALAPVLFLVSLNQGKPIDNGAHALVAAIPAHAPSEVILLNSPIELLSLYALTAMQGDESRRGPSALHQLYAGASELTAERIDERTLELVAADGWGRIPVERIFGSVADMPRAGEEIAVGSMRVRVRESTGDGRPKRVQFQFPTPLETDRLLLTWRGYTPVPWRPPPIGQKVPLERLSVFGSLNL